LNLALWLSYRAQKSAGRACAADGLRTKGKRSMWRAFEKTINTYRRNIHEVFQAKKLEKFYGYCVSSFIFLFCVAYKKLSNTLHA
jgi:predicted PolB exonuclease-like 3'-5' exonuclease